MGRNGACPDYATKLFGFKVCRFVMVAAFVLPVSSLKSGMLFTKAFSSTSQLIHNRGSDLLRQRSSKSRMSSLKAIYDVNRRNILALDFDGVVCASSVESSFSSIIAAEKFWPEACRIMKTRDVKSSYSPIETEAQDSTFRMVRSAVNELRPIVETGFENMLLVRAILEEINLTGNYL